MDAQLFGKTAGSRDSDFDMQALPDNQGNSLNFLAHIQAQSGYIPIWRKWGENWNNPTNFTSVMWIVKWVHMREKTSSCKILEKLHPWFRGIIWSYSTSSITSPLAKSACLGNNLSWYWYLCKNDGTSCVSLPEPQDFSVGTYKD